MDSRYDVSDEEQIFWLISSPNGYNEVTGLSADNFMLFKDNESYVSVERALFCTLDEAFVNGERIRNWFTVGESLWGAAILNVGKVRKHPSLDVVSKYTESHPGHAGIQMYLNNGLPYRFKKGKPTPMHILALQTYLVSIVEQIRKR